MDPITHETLDNSQLQRALPGRHSAGTNQSGARALPAWMDMYLTSGRVVVLACGAEHAYVPGCLSSRRHIKLPEKGLLAV